MKITRLRRFIAIFVFFQFVFPKIIPQQAPYGSYLEKEIVSNAIQNTKKAQESPYVIMLSIDGFRHDYAELHEGKHILEMAKNGSSTQSLIPSYPSKTFPNHYTLVTGLYPQNHGIIGNTFYDPNFDTTYRIANRVVVSDGSWYGGIPLWNLAQLQGMCSASYFWVGSEANINSLHPKYYYLYDKQTPYEYRVKRVLEWLELPELERPHMITLYFSLVDTQGHKFGPEAQETKEAVQWVDTQIGALREGIKKSGLPVYLIVTSDHGMQELKGFVNVNDYAAFDRERFVPGPISMMYAKTEAETDSLFNALQGKDFFRVYRRAELPDYLHYRDNDRIGDLVLIAEAPYTIINSKSDKKELLRIKGDHGFDPYVNKNMGGILYIEGPDIKKNYQLAPLENTHVYPLVAHLLGLRLMAPIDGRLEVLESVIKD
ncbi:MAG: ectonucleotide pyrophosphatase/phosphodiesterase [Bacteroidota bacterium]